MLSHVLAKLGLVGHPPHDPEPPCFRLDWAMTSRLHVGVAARCAARRGQVHVFGQPLIRKTRLLAEKWTSPQPACERLPVKRWASRNASMIRRDERNRTRCLIAFADARLRRFWQREERRFTVESQL